MNRRNIEEMSIDDLMRMQEQGPPRKRKRTQERAVAAEDSASDSGSQDNHDGPSAENSEGVSGDEDGVTEDDEGDENEGSEEEDDVLEDKQDFDPDALSRFSTSRVSTQPRKSLVVTRDGGPSSSRPLLKAFEDFGISSALLSALHKMSIRAPTEIQAACIPPLLQGECINAAT